MLRLLPLDIHAGADEPALWSVVARRVRQAPAWFVPYDWFVEGMLIRIWDECEEVSGWSC